MYRINAVISRVNTDDILDDTVATVLAGHRIAEESVSAVLLISIYE